MLQGVSRAENCTDSADSVFERSSESWRGSKYESDAVGYGQDVFCHAPREQVPYCEALAGKCLSQTCRETLEDMLSSKLCTQPRKSLELQRHWMYLQGHWIKRESVSHCTSMQQLLESYGTAAAEEGVHCTSQTLVFIRVGRNCHETTPEYYLCGWLWW